MDKSQEIIEQMQKKALSYVPEWRFSAENPDIGSALALVYAQMLHGTAEKLNYLPYKNQIAFFNALDASLLPAVPASGYVTFRMVNEDVEGQEVPAGMEVLASAKEGQEEEVSFETLDDIYVTPANVTCMLETSRKRDFIGTLDVSDIREQGIFLFAYETENLQVHRLYFCHDDALSVTQEGTVTADFLLRGEAVSERDIRSFADTGQAVFSYSSADGYVPFASVKRRGSRLEFTLGKSDPPFALRTEDGKNSYWICCEIRNLEAFEQFSFDALRLASGCMRRPFDYIYANGVEVSREDFFPFGERFSDYNEVYFLCDDVFRKKGADITMTFNLDFARIPLDLLEPGALQYEWIMRRSDFKPDLEFDVTIEEVVWEYFNGYGWAALMEKNQYSDIFSVKDGTVGQYKKMQFVCPDDIEPILVNARTGLCIRARVMKVNNLYKMRGYYIAPVMDQVHLQYDYTNRPVQPQHLVTENCRIRERYFPQPGKCPFYGLDREEEALYLGFDIAPAGAPVKIFFDFSKRYDKAQRTLHWEYAAGTDAWRELDIADETENMSRSGIVTLIDGAGFSRRRMYGYEKYWIRIRDVSEDYSTDGYLPSCPCLKGLYMNTVRAQQAERSETEYFHMEVYQENMQFHLLYKGVTAISIFVDELGSLTREELAQLKRQHRILPEFREDGELQRAWVKWEPVADFLNSGSTDRHFLLNGKEGSIRFGNGRAGRIPPAARTDNIRAEYKTGGGSYTNVRAGAIDQLGRTAGYISEVFNPKRMTGGSDGESLKDGLRRNAALLRHQNMAVTERDFEEIALEASRSLRRAKCFCGLDDKEQKKSGAVTLVLVQEDVKNAQVRFYDIKAEVENYMKDKVHTCLLDRGAFYCIAPKFVELCVRAEVAVHSSADIFRVRKQIQERLEQFLDPLDGNFDQKGWEIGVLPNSLQIQNAVSDIWGLAYIRNVYVSAFIGEHTDREEVDLDKVRRQKYILPVSGVHEVIVRIA